MTMIGIKGSIDSGVTISLRMLSGQKQIDQKFKLEHLMKKDLNEDDKEKIQNRRDAKNTLREQAAASRPATRGQPSNVVSNELQAKWARMRNRRGADEEFTNVPQQSSTASIDGSPRLPEFLAGIETTPQRTNNVSAGEHQTRRAYPKKDVSASSGSRDPYIASSDSRQEDDHQVPAPQKSEDKTVSSMQDFLSRLKSTKASSSVQESLDAPSPVKNDDVSSENRGIIQDSVSSGSRGQATENVAEFDIFQDGVSSGSRGIFQNSVSSGSRGQATEQVAEPREIVQEQSAVDNPTPKSSGLFSGLGSLGRRKEAPASSNTAPRVSVAQDQPVDEEQCAVDNPTPKSSGLFSGLGSLGRRKEAPASSNTAPRVSVAQDQPVDEDGVGSGSCGIVQDNVSSGSRGQATEHVAESRGIVQDGVSSGSHGHATENVIESMVEQKPTTSQQKTEAERQDKPTASEQKVEAERQESVNSANCAPSKESVADSTNRLTAQIPTNTAQIPTNSEEKVDTKRQGHEFKIGDKVIMRDYGDRDWLDGIVETLSPLKVRFVSGRTGCTWDEVQPKDAPKPVLIDFRKKSSFQVPAHQNNEVKTMPSKQDSVAAIKPEVDSKQDSVVAAIKPEVENKQDSVAATKPEVNSKQDSVAAIKPEVESKQDNVAVTKAEAETKEDKQELHISGTASFCIGTPEKETSYVDDVDDTAWFDFDLLEEQELQRQSPSSFTKQQESASESAQCSSFHSTTEAGRKSGDCAEESDAPGRHRSTSGRIVETVEKSKSDLDESFFSTHEQDAEEKGNKQPAPARWEITINVKKVEDEGNGSATKRSKDLVGEATPEAKTSTVYHTIYGESPSAAASGFISLYSDDFSFEGNMVNPDVLKGRSARSLRVSSAEYTPDNDSKDRFAHCRLSLEERERLKLDLSEYRSPPSSMTGPASSSTEHARRHSLPAEHYEMADESDCYPEYDDSLDSTRDDDSHFHSDSWPSASGDCASSSAGERPNSRWTPLERRGRDRGKMVVLPENARKAHVSQRWCRIFSQSRPASEQPKPTRVIARPKTANEQPRRTRATKSERRSRPMSAECVERRCCIIPRLQDKNDLTVSIRVSPGRGAQEKGCEVM